MSNFLQSLVSGQAARTPQNNNATGLTGLFRMPAVPNGQASFPNGLPSAPTGAGPPTLSSQMQDSQGLVHQVSSLLDGAHLNEDEVAGFRSTLALCRTLVNRLRVSQLQNAQQLQRGGAAASLSSGGLDAAKTQGWMRAYRDLLNALGDLLAKWRDRGVISEYLRDARQRRQVERLFNQLARHVQNLRAFMLLAKQKQQQQLLQTPGQQSLQTPAQNASGLAVANGASPNSAPVNDIAKSHASASLLSSTIPNTTSRTTSEAEELTDVSHMIEDKDGKEWWVNCFGGSAYVVGWQQFWNALASRSDVAPVLADQSEDFAQQLKESLDYANSGEVTAHKWGHFLVGFGPGILRSLLQMRSALSESWFAGFVTFDEANQMLQSCAPGSFLVRFSRTQPCAFAVAFVDPSNGKIIQARITARAAEADGGFELDGVRYPSLRELVEANASVLRVPAPTITAYARSLFFKGHISFEDSKALLAGQPIGTFLLRFSKSRPAALVVAYVDREVDLIDQSFIDCEPDNGGYRLGERLYASLDTLVRENKTKLAFPLTNDHEVSNGGGGVVQSNFENDTETQPDQSGDGMYSDAIGLYPNSNNLDRQGHVNAVGMSSTADRGSVVSQGINSELFDGDYQSL